jgi:hypothetical protein
MPSKIPVYLEIGRQRVFAAAFDWPGWCRSAKDEEAALQALIDYAPRYKESLGRAAQQLTLPKKTSEFEVVERVPGDSTTDFGAPGKIPRWDQRPIDQKEAKRLASLIKAVWKKFDGAAEAAEGKSLRKGPRGGGRDLEKMRRHVLEGEAAYLHQLGGKPEATAKDVTGKLVEIHDEFLDAVSGRITGTISSAGPRGGTRWPPRYAVRRAAWHVLDHAWEIEDRIE